MQVKRIYEVFFISTNYWNKKATSLTLVAYRIFIVMSTGVEVFYPLPTYVPAMQISNGAAE
jgi:hypothetical protein